MQRVKTYTAATGIVHGIGQQVVDIYQHCRDQEQVGRFPLLPEENAGDQRRDQEVQKQVKHL